MLTKSAMSSQICCQLQTLSGVGSARPKYANDDQISIFRGYLGWKSGLSILIWPKRQKLNAIQQKLRGRRWCRELPQGKVLRAWNWRQCRSYGGILDGYFGPQTVANLEIIVDHWASVRSWGGRQCDFYGINGGRKRPCIGWVNGYYSYQISMYCR